MISKLLLRPVVGSNTCKTLTHFFVQTLVSNLQTIINSLKGDDTAMQATPPFDDTQAQPVYNALNVVSSNLSYISYFSPLFHWTPQFVQTHQALLAVVLGKQPIFANYAAAQPILDVLKELKSAMDVSSFYCPSCNLD